MSSFEPSTKINFMKMRHFWCLISVLQVVWSVYMWNVSGTEKFGIDFLGGTDLIVEFKDPVEPNNIRNALFSKGLNNAIVQAFENGSNQFSIRMKGTDVGNVSNSIKEALKDTAGGITILKNDFVGPVIGEKIKDDGFKAVLIAVIGLLIYIGWRFDFSYGLGAVIAVFHDIVITVGVFIFLGGEIGAGALAALLTILGYSVNDTIITYDRIRENLRLKAKSKSEAKVGSLSLKDMSFVELINLSVNQTLSRTILTAGTTLFSCVALYLFGGGAISELSLVLL
jgi:preprotein translocase subunit SecF